MKQFRILATALAASALLAACGGGEPGNQAPSVSYGQMVSFGDSLSDVGSYRVGTVAAAKGGYFSVNGLTTDGASYTNWTEFLSAQLKLPAPCAAETGLNSVAAVFPLGPVAVTEHTDCYNYAQGGARVTDQPGPGNVLLFDPTKPSTYSNALGALTKPAQAQIAAHLAAHGGKFNSTDLVTVMAGGNDVFIQLGILPAKIAAYAAANGGDVAAATTKAGTEAVVEMGNQGVKLGTAVLTNIVAKGATHVVVVNLPDVSKTPLAYKQDAATQGLILKMVDTFNSALSATLASQAAAAPAILIVDAATAQRDEAANPDAYGLTNVKTPACDLAKAPSSLFCTANTLVAGDTTHYEFADDVHPTPYGYKLLAQLVAEKMVIKGWL